MNPIGPRFPYDEAKRNGEALVTPWARVTGVDVRTVRYSNTFGQRMRADGGRAVPTFAIEALRCEPLTVQGDGQQTRFFAYVDDSAEGTLLLARSGAGGPVNIGSDHGGAAPRLGLDDRADRGFVERGRSHRRRRRRPAPPPRPHPRQARTRLEAIVPLEEGLARTIDWFRSVPR